MSDSWTEAERAAFYRQQTAARRAFDRRRAVALAGDAALAAAVRANWLPLRQFQRSLTSHERERPEEDDADQIVN